MSREEAPKLYSKNGQVDYGDRQIKTADQLEVGQIVIRHYVPGKFKDASPNNWASNKYQVMSKPREMEVPGGKKVLVVDMKSLDDLDLPARPHYLSDLGISPLNVDRNTWSVQWTELVTS
jgi:hypothetical protein